MRNLLKMIIFVYCLTPKIFNMSRAYCIESSNRRKSVKIELTPDADFVCVTSRLGNSESYLFLSPAEAKKLARYLLKITSNKGEQQPRNCPKPNRPNRATDICKMTLEEFFAPFGDAWK